MPGVDGNVFEVGAVLKSLELRMAAINANWNGQGPDLMTPAELKNLMSATLSLQEECGKLLFAVGGYAARVGISERAA